MAKSEAVITIPQTSAADHANERCTEFIHFTPVPSSVAATNNSSLSYRQSLYAFLPVVKNASQPKKRKARTFSRVGFPNKSWRRPTLPRSCPRSTIGAGGLHFRVRYGNGCFPSAMATRNNSAFRVFRVEPIRVTAPIFFLPSNLCEFVL